MSTLTLFNLMTIQELIKLAGGATKFARLHGIGLRTVQHWLSGDRKPAEWLVRLIEKVQANGFNFRTNARE